MTVDDFRGESRWIDLNTDQPDGPVPSGLFLHA